MQAIHDISERPFQGDILRRLELQTIRETIAGKYRIYFAVHENEERIEVLHVWNRSRDMPDLN